MNEKTAYIEKNKRTHEGQGKKGNPGRKEPKIQKSIPTKKLQVMVLVQKNVR